jgi:methylated-DNA-[protein]-cysteine S-methyltransferase
MIRATVPSPFGALTLTETGGRITALSWGGGAGGPDTPVLAAAADQLARYFSGSLREFDLPLDLGTGFQRAFLAALIAIPCGETRTYGDLARALGVSAQAIGQACGANRIPILIPCHRILGATGLGGYSGMGGVETKVALLRLEGAAGLLI